MATYISNNPPVIVNRFIHSEIMGALDGQNELVIKPNQRMTKSVIPAFSKYTMLLQLHHADWHT